MRVQCLTHGTYTFDLQMRISGVELLFLFLVNTNIQGDSIAKIDSLHTPLTSDSNLGGVLKYFEYGDLFSRLLYCMWEMVLHLPKDKTYLTYVGSEVLHYESQFQPKIDYFKVSCIKKPLILQCIEKNVNIFFSFKNQILTGFNLQ